MTLAFDQFLKKLTLVITSLGYNTRASLLHIVIFVTRSFYWYPNICPCPSLELAINGGIVFHKHILFQIVTRTSPDEQSIYLNQRTVIHFRNEFRDWNVVEYLMHILLFCGFVKCTLHIGQPSYIRIVYCGNIVDTA